MSNEYKIMVELSAVFFPQALSNDAPLQDLGLFSILKSYGVTAREIVIKDNLFLAYLAF